MKKSGSAGVKVKFPIGVKLAFILGIIILVSLGTVTVLSSVLMGQDVKITAERNNLALNSRASDTIEDKLSSVRSNVFQLLDLMNAVSGGKNAGNAKQAISLFLERNADIACIYVLSKDSLTLKNPTDDRIVNNRFFISNEIDTSTIDLFLKQNSQALTRACSGETVALNASPFIGMPVLALFFPWKENGRDQACVIMFSMESITEILGVGSENTTFIINDNDDLLSHPQTERILAGESFKNHPLIEAMRKNNQNNQDSRQIPFVYTDSNGKKHNFYGAYEKLSFGDIVVLTTVGLETVLEGVRNTRTNNIFITGIVFFLAILIILFFSRFAISNHLRKLSSAANEIQKGNFDTDIIDTLNTKRQDEIGVLNEATKNEREFLNTFAKFTNKGVAKAIARKEIDFTPHLKDVTIFFSDIRGFTAISDGFKNKFGNESPKEIIGFLNDYMGRMVECITLSGGNVDKFEGDAIMAVWGILRDESLDFEKMSDTDPQKKELKQKHYANILEDALNAVKGTIAMRYALMKYNKDAQAFTKQHESEENAKYKPHIQIGCGLNTGRATCGIMGGEDKLEYTAIGDAVNFASRTESSNKACGTDILITEDTYRLLKTRYIKNETNNFTLNEKFIEDEIVVEKIPVEFEVKGKGAQHFYGVVNMPNFDIEKFFKVENDSFVLDEDCARAVGKTGPKTLNEVRTLLGIPIPDFEKVNLNEEENKVKVKQ